MKIQYREVDSKNIQEVRSFFVCNEYCWRDSDPLDFIARTDERRDAVATEFIEKLNNQNKDEKYHCLAAFDDNEMIASNFLDKYMISLNKELGYTIARYNFRKTLS